MPKSPDTRFTAFEQELVFFIEYRRDDFMRLAEYHFDMSPVLPYSERLKPWVDAPAPEPGLPCRPSARTRMALDALAIKKVIACRRDRNGSQSVVYNKTRAISRLLNSPGVRHYRKHPDKEMSSGR